MEMLSRGDFLFPLSAQEAWESHHHLLPLPHTFWPQVMGNQQALNCIALDQEFSEKLSWPEPLGPCLW